MRLTLRVAALLLVAGAGVWWMQAGRNTGWHKDQVAVTKTDEITGIEFVEYEPRFVPGIDVLAAAAAGGLLLTGISFFIKRRPAR